MGRPDCLAYQAQKAAQLFLECMHFCVARVGDHNLTSSSPASTAPPTSLSARSPGWGPRKPRPWGCCAQRRTSRRCPLCCHVGGRRSRPSARVRGGTSRRLSQASTAPRCSARRQQLQQRARSSHVPGNSTLLCFHAHVGVIMDSEEETKICTFNSKLVVDCLLKEPINRCHGYAIGQFCLLVNLCRWLAMMEL